MNPIWSFLIFFNLLLLFLINANCSIIDNEVSAERKNLSNSVDDISCALPKSVTKEIASYAKTATQIIEYFTSGPYKGKTWESLAKFVDTFGNRIAGSKNLEDAIDYMLLVLKQNQLENVHTEKVKIPRWIRGNEYAELLSPRKKSLPILGLGYSVGTPDNGIEAAAVVVTSFEELHKLSNESVKGKIVVYAQAFESYDVTVKYRSDGASEASKKGAVAALVRSITPFSMNTPHTGMQTYQKDVIPIPVAAITVEDALELLRMQKRKLPISIKLKMSAQLKSAVSRNTIADLTGREHPEKIVLVSGHLDSWDVGEGAIDDGGGAFISWTAPAILKQLNLRPRRTLRSILWTAEEEGIVGSIAYEKAHRGENKNINFVMESDIGTFEPLGLSYTGKKKGECIMREIGKLFSSINATQVVNEDSGPDLTAFIAQGIPAGGLKNQNDRYFWYHHTEADRITAIDPDALDRCAAYWAAFSFIVADLSFDIPRT